MSVLYAAWFPFQEENPADMLKKEGCIIIPKDLS